MDVHILHVDDRDGSIERGDIFGHDGTIIPFKEGLIAKQIRSGELHFFKTYFSFGHGIADILSPDLIPEIVGISFPSKIKDSIKPNAQVSLEIHKDLDTKDPVHIPFLIERDISSGFQQPATLDIKIGCRTWKIGASPQKAASRRAKDTFGPNKINNFRVRGAMWHNENGQLSIIDRGFAKKNTMEDIQTFFKSFFRDPYIREKVLAKLKRLLAAMIKLHDHLDVRLYSSSILFVYDELNHQKVDCRLLDFEKAYIGYKTEADKYHESYEDCEDNLPLGCQRLINMISQIDTNETC